MFDTIMKIITTPCMGYVEKRAILITLRDQFIREVHEAEDLTKFIEMYDKLIKDQEEASNALKQYLSPPHVIPC